MAEDPLSEEVIEQATQLTRWARRAAQPAATTYRERRAELVAAHGYTARVRESETNVLVLYPEEWVVDGTVRRDRIDDLDRGVERPLSGDTPDEDWEHVWAHNCDLADTVETSHGPVHGANAQALAEFASNHYAARIERLSSEALHEFITEYFPRNAWPSAEQKAVVEKSVRLTFVTAGEPEPTIDQP